MYYILIISMVLFNFFMENLLQRGFHREFNYLTTLKKINFEYFVVFCKLLWYVLIYSKIIEFESSFCFVANNGKVFFKFLWLFVLENQLNFTDF